MIDKLKFLIDASEGNPRLKSILLRVANLPEDKQSIMLDMIELLIKTKGV